MVGIRCWRAEWESLLAQKAGSEGGELRVTERADERTSWEVFGK